MISSTRNIPRLAKLRARICSKTDKTSIQLRSTTIKKETFDYIAKRVDILAVSDFSTQITKDAALAWKNAVAADNSDAAVEEATTNLLNILEGRPTTIDGVIAFLEGPMMGEEAAAQGLAAQLARKEAGAKWCDCEACSAATEILAKFGRIADLPQN